MCVNILHFNPNANITHHTHKDASSLLVTWIECAWERSESDLQEGQTINLLAVFNLRNSVNVNPKTGFFQPFVFHILIKWMITSYDDSDNDDVLKWKFCAVRCFGKIFRWRRRITCSKGEIVGTVIGSEGFRDVWSPAHRIIHRHLNFQIIFSPPLRLCRIIIRINKIIAKFITFTVRVEWCEIVNLSESFTICGCISLNSTRRMSLLWKPFHLKHKFRNCGNNSP